jgi:hypothetical protein
MADEVRNAVLDVIEASLDAQLRAVRRLRTAASSEREHRPRKSLSQVDMAYDVLQAAGGPLHISELLARVQVRFGVTIDRESLVSSLSKKVQRGDRFTRTGKNAFGLRPEKP